jgi:hypothetical protein
MTGVVQQQPELGALQEQLQGVVEQIGLINNNSALSGIAGTSHYGDTF